MNVDDHQEALDIIKKAFQARPNNASEYFHLGLAYVKLSIYQNAIEAFQQAIRIQPDHAGAHFGLGIAFMSLKDIRVAWNEYEILKNLNQTLANQLLDFICLNKAREEILVELERVKGILAESYPSSQT